MNDVGLPSLAVTTRLFDIFVLLKKLSRILKHSSLVSAVIVSIGSSVSVSVAVVVSISTVSVVAVVEFLSVVSSDVLLHEVRAIDAIITIANTITKTFFIFTNSFLIINYLLQRRIPSLSRLLG